MHYQRVSPLDLTFADIVAWRRFIEAQPQFANPFFSPEWAQAVARQRPDAEVVIFRKGVRAVGYLPVQRSSPHTAVPAGGAVCAYQALIGPSDPSFDLAEAAGVLGVKRIDFTCALAESGLGKHLQTEETGWVASFDQGWEAYAAERKAAGSTGVVDAARGLRSLSTSHAGRVRFEAFAADPEAFEQLIAWRRSESLKTGAPDVFDHAWIQRLVEDTFRAPRTSTFGGALFVLRIDGKPAAALYCLTARKSLHAWVAASDPAHAGLDLDAMVMVSAIRAAAQAGFAEMDFGPEVSALKLALSNRRLACGAAFLAQPGLAGAMRSAEFGLRALVESLPVGPVRAWPAQAMRRADFAAGVDAAPARSANRVA